ncbi:GMC family oxidoreductase N-terminal domain-containing protein [Kibdelosporangium philippinense]|uniref:GMC family oxidoreductase N-terminal domain-containing protein n=1 Tax=Kibdelosporangium philippinense TaxID=211113 RepID=A0ABS8ZKY0_9PSEU|nr:GMC oxidoreductase [Kibdelosporangium philippinense]MCE7008124.1 GMC family oxidoreductase N-terminal domain-containing protein [Kibdelosporangium philippinense]
MTSYDYVVVGAGSAGCAVAARLSRDARGLLIEAGSAKPPTALPRLAWSLYETSANWADKTADGTLDLPRGRGVGGSSAINAMVWARGHRSSYDWGPGWTFDDLLPYFRRSETAAGRDPVLRGTAGPLTVSPALHQHPLAAAGLEAALEIGHPEAKDVSGGLEEGFGWPDLCIVDGQRQSVADAYLPQDNVDVVADAFVHRIRMRNGRVAGVDYNDTTVDCPQVILTAGTIGSAQLLQLSGIGPADDLRALGIPVVEDLPVGENLHDHALFSVKYDSTRPVPESLYNGIEVIGLAGDLQFLYFARIPIGEVYGIYFSLMAPHSRGRLRLASPRPEDRPLIDPAYLSDSRDMETALTGLDMARALGATRALAPWRGVEPGIGDAKAYLREDLSSYYHYVGTCAMGSVVAPDLQVYGIEGLRVADASVIPDIPSANTNATVVAIAERAAALLNDERVSG